MDTKTQIPAFTVSLRGYDRLEVDEYLDSLAEALDQVEEAKEQNRRLHGHIARLNGRIEELEERIGTETPKTGALIGERVSLLLRTAEDTATETVGRAEQQAARLAAQAEARVAEAEETARACVARGESEARGIEAAARGQAAEIVADAEARAAARTKQIEQWADEVISRNRGEDARMRQEMGERRRAAEAGLAELLTERDRVAGILDELRETLGAALGLAASAGGGISASVVTAAVVAAAPAAAVVSDGPAAAGVSDGPAAAVDPGASAEPSTASGPDAADGAEPETAAVEVLSPDGDGAGAEDATGEIELRDMPAADDFEEKLEAWVSGGSDRRSGGM